MRCVQVRDRIGDLLAGALDNRTARKVQEHLDVCATCVAERDLALRVRTLLRREPPELGQAGRDRVARRFRSRCYGRAEAGLRSRRRSISWRPALSGASVLAAAVVLMMIGLRIGPRGGPDDQAGPMPTAAEMNTMSFLHAAQSRTLMPDAPELMRDTLAEELAHRPDDGGDEG